jgi:diaminopimelate decarboxylase
VADHVMTPTAASDKLASSWVRHIDIELIVESVGTPVFIYSETQLRRNIDRIMAAAEAAGIGDRVDLYIPFFPNSNPHVLRPLRELGAGLLLQLPGEYEILRRFGFDRFIVSPGHVSNEEIAFWAGTAYPTFLSSLDEISYAMRIAAPSIDARIDGLDSGKPGIKFGELGQLSDLLKAYDRELGCFEVYTGSGNSRREMTKVIETMFTIFLERFPTARSINFAGGHGFVYESWDEEQKHFEWHHYFKVLRETAERMRIPDHVRFLFEPARDVLADTGVLLLGIKRDVITNPVGSILVTDGSRMLMPSAQLRERRHNVAFVDAAMSEITAEDPRKGIPAAIRGRSILRHDYILPGEYRIPADVDSRSYLMVLDVGVYCATQHMEFLNIPPAAEVLIDAAGSVDLVTSVGSDLDKWRNLLPERQKLTRRQLALSGQG